MWVWVFLAIGVAGFVMVLAYAVWLWHKVSDVFAEVAMLGVRACELADLVSAIKVAPTE